MATSGSTNFATNRDSLIAGALRLCGAIAQGETPSATLLSESAEALNIKKYTLDRMKKYDPELHKIVLAGRKALRRLKNLENRREYAKSDYSKQVIRNCLYKKKYGITLEEFEELELKQEYKCAICGNEESKLTVKGDRTVKLSVDHCHSSNKVRELLCHRCNIILGIAEDSTKLLLSCAGYLERHNVNK